MNEPLKARELLRARFIRALEAAREKAEQDDRPVLAIVSAEVEPQAPIAMISAWSGYGVQRFFWQCQTDVMVGFGAAQTLSDKSDQSSHERFRECEQQWQALRAQLWIEGPCLPRWCGGFAFDPEAATSDLWRHFPSASLTLPRLMYLSQRGQFYLVVAHWISSDTCSEALVCQLLNEWYQLLEKAEVVSAEVDASTDYVLQDCLEASLWKSQVANTIEAIQQGAMHKAVLARTVVMALPHGVLVAEVLQQLAEHYPEAYLFAFERDGHCFLGASPERLVRLQQGQLETMALAGTIARGTTLSEDEVLGDQLMNSRKDQYEHQLVVNSLREALSPLCRTLTIPEVPRLHRLAQVQHLLTPVQGTLSADVGALSLVSVLHPTPAVGGLPRDIALQHIRTHEQMDRGWYAGPVGWLDSEGNAEFAVALRSGLLRDDKAYLFAGCGIVADSQPDAEYQETCLKLKTMVAALSA